MKVPVYNQEGKEVGEALLPKEIFDVKLNSDLVHQVAVAQSANRRIVTAHTKNRGEVSGGGRKPWRQKGTGRARHGSIRSPIWKGGGVVFGPRKDRDYSQKINKKMRRKALFMVLTSKVKEGNLVVIEDLNIETPKTKLIAETLNNLPVKGNSCLIAVPGKNENLLKASRNIEKTRMMAASDLNVLDLLTFKFLLMPKDSIKQIKSTFLKTNNLSEQ